MEVDTHRGRGERDGPERNGSSQQTQNQRHNRHAHNNSGPSTSRGSQGGTRNREAKANTKCWKKRIDLDKSKSVSSKTKHENWHRSDYRIRQSRTGKSATITLCLRLRRSRNMPCLCDKAQGKLYEGAHLEAEQGVICGFWWVQPHDEPWRIVLTSWKVGTVEGRRNRRRHLTSHRACQWPPLDPCWP